MKRKVLLITGANGFLARAVVRQTYDDWQLNALVRPETKAASRFHMSYESVDRLISDLEHVDAVMHLAACIPVPINAAPEALIPTNVDLVAKLVNAYPDAVHVLASSVSIYGIPLSLPLKIGSPPCQPNAYGLSKLAAENLVRQARKHAVIRFSSLIGVGMKTGSFIPVAVSAARAGRIRLLGQGERLQNYLDIDDAASMCWQAITSKESFIALGISGQSHSNNEVANLLSELTGASVVREGEDRSPSYVYEPNDAMSLARPYINLKESLAKMVGLA